MAPASRVGLDGWVLGESREKRGAYRRVSVAETTKQNIFIHEFIQPKHASNPWKLTVQNGSQVGGDRAPSSKARARHNCLSHSDHQQRLGRKPGLSESRPARFQFLKGSHAIGCQPAYWPSCLGPGQRDRGGTLLLSSGKFKKKNYTSI